MGEGVYRIKAAAEQAGVTPELLRAWERRYGVPSPGRSPSGYRLYSEEDIRAVRWILGQTESGLGPRQAAGLFKGNLSGAAEESTLRTVRTTLLGLLLARELGKAKALLERAILGHGFETVCTEVIWPLLAWVGEMWHRGEITPADEHWVSESLKSVLIRRLTQERNAAPNAVRAVVACAPGELHEIGALMLALFLTRRGFDVLYLGQGVPLAALRRFVRKSGAKAIFLSMARKNGAKRILEELPAFEIATGARVFVGGLAFESESLRRAAGKRFLAPDARKAADAASELLRG